MIINASYFIEYTPEIWGVADITVVQTGEIASIQVNDTSINIQKPCIYPAYDSKNQQAFWLGFSSSGHVYRLDYNQATKSVEKAKHLTSPSSKYLAIPEELKNLPEFPSNKKASDMFERIKTAYMESQRSPTDLLTLAEIEGLSLRPADITERIQLIGAQDDIRDKSLAYQKQCEAEYTAQVREALQALIASHSDDYAGLKDSLKAYLREHWKTIKGNPLSYLALPDSPVTQLLVNLAKKLEAFENMPAISYLMPDVYTQHVANIDLNLERLELSWILKTHVLDETGHYLLPVDLLLAHARLTDEEPSHWVSPTGLMHNPYCDSERATDASHKHVSLGDLEHMYRHSVLTQGLRDAYRRYEAVKLDAPSLLGQLNVLMPVLKRSDAHGGLGQQRDVHSAAYPAIMRFMAYYRRLHPMGLVVADHGMPPSHAIFKEDSLNTLSYVLVKSGDAAGLYCVSRYNDDGSLRTAEEACAHKVMLCDAETPARYALHVMAVNQFEDTAELRAKLGDEQPSLIHVQGEPTEQYHIYGRQVDDRWGFSTIQAGVAIRLPKNSADDIIFDRKVVHPLGNVPAGIYHAIESKNAHHEQDGMLINLRRYFSESAQICTLEQLAFVEAQTGHLDLDEFKDVPKAVRGPINDLWQFIQNSSVNLSVDTVQTCAGMLRERLERVIRTHLDALQEITWSAAERTAEFEACGQNVVEAREAFAHALEEKSYRGGKDVRPPTYAMLKALGKQLEINGPADFNWFCYFDAESIGAFLSDPDNQGPLRYLQNNYYRFNDLPLLLLEIPPFAFKPIIEHLNIDLTARQLGQLIEFVEYDKAQALLEAIHNKLSQIIKDGKQLGAVLQSLSSEKCRAVLEAVQDRLPEIIKDEKQLGAVLEYLSSEKCRVVLEAVQDRLPEIIRSVSNLSDVLEFLEEADQIEVVLEAVQVLLPNIIHDGGGLGEALQFSKKEQFFYVLEKLQDQLPKIISNGYELADAFFILSEEKRATVFKAVQDRLPQIILNGSNLGDMIRRFAENQSGDVFESVDDQLSQIIPREHELGAVLQLFDERLRDVIFKAVQKQLPQIIHNDSRSINTLTISKRDVVFKAVRNQVLQYIPYRYALGATLCYLTEAQRDIVLEAVQNKLLTIIRNGEQLGDALQYLTEAQCHIVLEAIKNELPTIIRDGVQLGDALQYLTEAQCHIVLRAVQDKLPTIIHDGVQLGDALQYLTEAQRDIVLEAVQNKLLTIIRNGEQLGDALRYLTEAQCHIVLGAVKNELREIIHNAKQLGAALRYLTEAQCHIVLRAVDFQLPRLIPDGEHLGYALRYLTL